MGDIDLNKYEMLMCYELKMNGSYQYKIGNQLDWQFTDGLLYTQITYYTLSFKFKGS